MKKHIFKDLSLIQLVSGAGAAVTAALISTKIGIAGTTIGVAFGSIIGSLATAFYKNSISMSHHVLKDVVVKRSGADGLVDLELANTLEMPIVEEVIAEELSSATGTKKSPSWGTLLMTGVISFIAASLVFIVMENIQDAEAAEPLPTVTTIVKEPINTVTTVIVKEPGPSETTIIYVTPEPEESDSPSPTPSLKPTPEPSIAPTPTVEPKPSPTPTPSQPTPSPTPTPSSEPSPSPEPTSDGLTDQTSTPTPEAN